MLKKFLFPIIFFLLLVGQSEAAYVERADCDELLGTISANKVTCKQTTSVSGRIAGQIYNWDGAAWVAMGGGTGTFTGDAGDVPFVSGQGLSSGDVEAALDELQVEKQPIDAQLTTLAGLSSVTNLSEVANLPDGLDTECLGWDTGAIVSKVCGGAFSGDASDVPFTPAGTIAATDVQAAIEEASGDMTTHAALTNAHSATATNTASRIVLRDGSGNFAAGTITATLTGNSSTATALAANGSNCSTGEAPVGVDASGAAESCTDVATQAELDTHTNSTSPHSSTSSNTASRLVLRDASGNFSAGTITASLTGTASAATALASNPTDCTQAGGILAFAHTIAASGNLTCSILVVTSASSPTVDEDTGDGYIIGTKWINTATDTIFEAVDVTAANAVWQQVFPQVSGGVADTLAKYATSSTLTTSSITDDGSEVTISADLCVGDCSGGGFQIGIFRAFWPAGAITVDGTQCPEPTKQQLNSGPKLWTFSCADNNASIFEGYVKLTKAVNTVTLTLDLYHATTESITFAGDFAVMCRAESDVINGTYSAGVAADVAITTAHDRVSATSAAITPNGTCSAGSTLFWKYTVDAANFGANAANAKILGVYLVEAS